MYICELKKIDFFLIFLCFLTLLTIIMATIEGFDNYLIYPDGTVFSIKREMFLKPYKNKIGYYVVRLYKNGKGYMKTIHRLMGLTFIPNPNGKPQIDHIDRDKTNNNVENLRWATISENQQNTSHQCNNKLGIKNIRYNETRQRYRFRKTINKIIHRKYFKTLDEAIAYKETYLNNNV